MATIASGRGDERDFSIESIYGVDRSASTDAVRKLTTSYGCPMFAARQRAAYRDVDHTR